MQERTASICVARFVGTAAHSHTHSSHHKTPQVKKDGRYTYYRIAFEIYFVEFTTWAPAPQKPAITAGVSSGDLFYNGTDGTQTLVGAFEFVRTSCVVFLRGEMGGG
jgi:hypothetical protein